LSFSTVSSTASSDGLRQHIRKTVFFHNLERFTIVEIVTILPDGETEYKVNTFPSFFKMDKKSEKASTRSLLEDSLLFGNLLKQMVGTRSHNCCQDSIVSTMGSLDIEMKDISFKLSQNDNDIYEIDELNKTQYWYSEFLKSFNEQIKRCSGHCSSTIID